MSQYKNLRRFIYRNVRAEYRAEGYRLAKKTVEEERERCARIAWRFWGVTMETYVCKKCGAELILDDIKNWSKRACPECDEPIPQEEVVRAMKC